MSRISTLSNNKKILLQISPSHFVNHLAIFDIFQIKKVILKKLTDWLHMQGALLGELGLGWAGLSHV
jgi:hypothetical protein